MKISDLINKDKIILQLKGKTKNEVYKELAQLHKKTGAVSDIDGYLSEIMKREEISSTALENGICVPHAKSKYVNTPSIVFGRALEGVDCNSMDGEPSTLFFMIAMPQDANNQHVEALSKLTTMLLNDEFLKSLLSLNTEKEIINLINSMQDNKNEQEAVNINSDNFIVAVTACPTGIAHTYMAEESLKKAAKELNIPLRVETNGTDGAKNKLTDEEIKQAKTVILAVDRGVEVDRFKGKRVIQTGTKPAIKDAKGLLHQALNHEVPIFSGSDDSSLGDTNKKDKTGVYKHLMTGVSFMLPFVISGGILIALAFIFDRIAGVQGGADLGSTTEIAQLFMTIGGTAFDLFIPILGAYIAYSIADRAALTPGFVGAAIASSGGGGFLGALAAGFLAGYITKGVIYLLRKTPKSMNGIKSILIYPILTVGLTGLILLIFLNPPMMFLDNALTNWLNNLAGGSKFLLGLLIGGMMAIDMGGPINKAAYVFSIGTLASATSEFGTTFMATAMAGGMVPPLGIGLATIIFKNRFNTEETEAGKTNIVLGLTFITEGAIPFAAADPLKVLPASAIGAAVSGALVMLLDISLPVPHGGLVVMFLSNKPLLYIISVLIGSMVTCALLGLLKKPISE